MVITRTSYPNELIHYGIRGQTWGVRRYQNKDGSLTLAGRKRYGIGQYTDTGTGNSSSRDGSTGTRKVDRITDTGTGTRNAGYVSRAKGFTKTSNFDNGGRITDTGTGRYSKGSVIKPGVSERLTSTTSWRPGPSYGAGRSTGYTDAGTGRYSKGSVIKPGAEEQTYTYRTPSMSAGRATGYTDAGTGHRDTGYVARAKASSGDYVGAGRTVSAGARQSAKRAGTRLSAWWGRTKSKFSNIASSIRNAAKTASKKVSSWFKGIFGKKQTKQIRRSTKRAIPKF